MGERLFDEKEKISLIAAYQQKSIVQDY